MDKQELIDVLTEEEALVCDDLEDALIGMTRNPATGDIIAVYDRNKCIEARMKEGMTYEEACEFHSFNTEGAYVGPKTPLFIETIE